MTTDCICDKCEWNFYRIYFCAMQQTGDVLIENDLLYNHHEYCILHEVHANTNESTTSVLVCFNDNDAVQTRHNILSYGMNLPQIFTIFN